ncbi:MAG TPA: DUF2155 domain-containing protein [Parvularculaceae bacterium]|nr:DUF2155 domain-containing protein [Parvularculaceae bacterium]
MRFFFLPAAVAFVVGSSFASAQAPAPSAAQPDASPPPNAPSIDRDPALDALGETPRQQDELDRLSKSPDDVFEDSGETKKRIGVSVTLRALDKITAQYTDIEAPIGKPVKFGSLEILPHYCDKRPPEEFPETTAFLEIFDRGRSRSAPAYKDPALAAAVAESDEPKESKPVTDDYSVKASVPTQPFGGQAGDAAAPDSPGTDGSTGLGAAPADPNQPAAPVDPDRIFSGWMFASSPSLNALEDPVYDVWVIDCKTQIVDK